MDVVAILFFVAILAALGAALWSLFSRRADRSRSMLNALTLRVSLSVLFFLLLLAAWYMGWIEPHGIAG